MNLTPRSIATLALLFASMPALHAQWKLASGKGLVYRVAEKGSRKVHAPVAAQTAAEPEPIGAIGGGQ